MDETERAMRERIAALEASLAGRDASPTAGALLPPRSEKDRKAVEKELAAAREELVAYLKWRAD
jgi:hypothetical protein